MNTFDFYTVTATASRVRDLIAAGIDRAKCRQFNTGKVRVYGARAFPILAWEAKVGYVDVVDANCRQTLEAMKAKYTCAGVTVTSYYNARD